LPDGTIGEITEKDLAGNYVLLFFYPADFTFVCPSEIIAHDRRIAAFAERGVKVIGIGVDGVYSHHAWKQVPVEKGGIGAVSFPLVADVRHELTQAYGIEHPDGVAYRGTFLIDREGVVRHQVVNDLPLGRNVDEALRLVDALQFFEENGEVCPAGWQKGDAGMTASPEGVASYLSEHSASL
jgi:peroxiredoxin (alkyl hydroperoxide reductase subunit C)